MAKPIRTVKLVKKRTKRFLRHQSDRFKRVKVRASLSRDRGMEIPGHPYTGDLGLYKWKKAVDL